MSPIRIKQIRTNSYSYEAYILGGDRKQRNMEMWYIVISDMKTNTTK